MAKKRKAKTSSTKSKAKKTNKSAKGKDKDIKKKQPKGTPEGFWRQVAALSMFLLAVLMLFGSIGKGGTLSVNIFEWARWVVGYVAYFMPALLFVVGFIKIRGEDHKIPRPIFWGLMIMIFAAGGFAHLFVDEGMSRVAVEAGEGGGAVGHIAYSLIIGPLSRVTGGLVLFFISVIALHFVFRLPLTYLLKFLKITPRQKPAVADGEVEAAEKVDDIKPPKFKLNEGVPVERSKSTGKPAVRTVKVREALTTTADPDWNYPPLDLLDKTQDKVDAGDVTEKAELIKTTLQEFGIKADMQSANVGPRITQYTLSPQRGVKLSKISALDDNLSLNLAAESIRIEAPIPGKSAVGIEVPNKKYATVRLHSVLDSKAWKQNSSPLSFVLGKDIAGNPVVKDLDPMPHLLIAGATGTGKSVMVHSLIVSLLYRNSPSDLKLILVDPKQVELAAYKDIPHLLTPVITETDKCVSALKWAVNEMERRYRVLEQEGKRNIQSYNKAKQEEGMPYIVIVIDELADLMQQAQRDVEALIARLAAKARAVGVHLVMATQTPRKEIITGTIKANIPARVALKTVSQVDSRVIMDRSGAEKLLSLGDMLFMGHNSPNLARIQGAYLADSEVDAVCDYVRMEGAPQYDDEVVSQPVNLGGKGSAAVGVAGDEDDLFEEAVDAFIQSGRASTSYLQSKFKIGYSRANNIMMTMEEKGIIGPPRGSKPRELLVSSLDEALRVNSEIEQDYEPEPYEENF